MATRRKKKSSELDEILHMLGFLLRTEVQGIVLVLLSVFTLLSLFTNSRGSITGAWIDLVRALTGDGVWGVPLLTGALGTAALVVAIVPPAMAESDDLAIRPRLLVLVDASRCIAQ